MIEVCHKNDSYLPGVTQPVEQLTLLLEKIFMNQWVTSLKQNEVDVACGIHIPALMTCWIAKFLYNNNVPKLLTLCFLAFIAVWMVTEGILYASLNPKRQVVILLISDNTAQNVHRLLHLYE